MAKRLTRCVYCGVNVATTRDHVIPRGIWGDVPPPNLSTVPACENCNQAYSRDEGYFRLCVSTGLAYEHPVVRNETWPGPIRRMLRKGARLRADLVRNARPATLQLSTGLVIPTISVLFDPRRIGDILEKMARGTYYVGLKKMLPQDVRTRTYYGIPDELESFYKECPEHDLGSGIVRVRWGYDVNEPSFMFCWFRFYDDKSFTVLAQRKASST